MAGQNEPRSQKGLYEIVMKGAVESLLVQFGQGLEDVCKVKNIFNIKNHSPSPS